MTKKQTNSEEKMKKLEKMQEYLNARKEIFDFIINRNVRNVILCYLGILSVVLLVGGDAYIDYKVKGRVEERLSEKIDEEYTYLSERNNIVELGDQAISTNKIRYYEDLKVYLSSKKPERIRTAAKAEMFRIESYLATYGYSGFDPYDTKESELSADQLNELCKETNSMDRKISAFYFLCHRYNKETPDILLSIAKSTENLRLRYISLNTLQLLLRDSSNTRLNYDENFELWEKNKEKFYQRMDESEKK